MITIGTLVIKWFLAGTVTEAEAIPFTNVVVKLDPNAVIVGALDIPSTIIVTISPHYATELSGISPFTLIYGLCSPLFSVILTVNNCQAPSFAYF